jgi:hypothetical protein
VVAFPLSILRTVVAKLMVGIIDEYHQQGQLVAFSHYICKGDTVRAMWFYQRERVSNCCIWFHSLRRSVERLCTFNENCTSNRLRWLDLGPSYNSQVADVKLQYGFKKTEDWPALCNYSGDWIDI